jgi:hypothetical protein
LDGGLESKVEVANLQSHISLEKLYYLTLSGEDNSPEKTGPLPLSDQVLNPESRQQSFADARNIATKRIMDDLRGRLRPQRSLLFDSAMLSAGPLPLEIRNHETELRLVNGLPRIDYFQMDLMDGTIAGSVSISRNEGAFILEAGCILSGLNAGSLLPNTIRGAPDENAEISGQFSLSLPLSVNPRRLLQDLGMDLNITHIGPETLELLLYAMDPYESNETIVNQRKLLRMGAPRWINLDIDHGSLSLSGQVQVKGISLDLPRIERLNLTDLPVHKQLEAALSGFGGIIDLLKIISSDSIYLGNDGMISFGYSGS